MLANSKGQDLIDHLKAVAYLAKGMAEKLKLIRGTYKRMLLGGVVS